MDIRLTQETALNLTLQGSVGSFQVGTGQSGPGSLQVKYFLTHVGLNFTAVSNEALLSALTPVRETFEYSTLDFDEIMQRDIDDARVSAELVPYLLDEHSAGTIKLFPPIVVMVLPVEEGKNRPANRYPPTTAFSSPDDGQRGYPLWITRSGSVGKEVFQFEQPEIDGARLCHDKVRLRLNTHRTRLVIVDGQHRAMALLAIYRNLMDQWTDERRLPFKEYYTEWAPSYIQRFNLTEINMPVILCTVPDLDANYIGDFDLKKAARSIFLTLNKTARKVSDSRNRLLDDNDIIAYMMRRCLSEVKKRDNRSPTAFRIHNIELDQFGDRLKVQSPVALTGVNHIYYIVEHCLLDSGDVKGIAPRSGKFYKRTNLNDFLDRLNGRDLLGLDVSELIRRDSFTDDAANKLGNQFLELYGSFIVEAFEEFLPFRFHNEAALSLESTLDKMQDRQLGPILFEGQGIGRVFEAHRENLKKKVGSGFFGGEVPEIRESLRRLEATSERIQHALSGFRRERASSYFDKVSDKRFLKDASGSIHERLVEWINGVYDNIFFTVAFQAAIICGFFGLVEKAGEAVRKAPADSEPLHRSELFKEYLEQLGAFFVPRTFHQLSRLIHVLSGEPRSDDWRISQTNYTFRNVVYRGEMQPDQWPKYKYILIELWKPSHPVLRSCVEAERDNCRRQVFSALHEHYRTNYCSDNRKLDDELTAEEKREIFEKAYDAYNGLLRNVGGVSLERATMKKAASEVSAVLSSDSEQGQETWVDNGEGS